MRQLKPGDFTTVPCNSVAGMDPYSQTVYMWLCQHANGSNVCWPSIETLMKTCGIKSRGGVKNALKTLEAKGLVKKNEREKGGTNETNLYEVFYDDSPGHTIAPPGSYGDSPRGHMVATELNPVITKAQDASRRSRPVKKSETYETQEEIPGIQEVSDNQRSLITTLYALGWRWPKSKTADEFSKSVRSALLVSGIAYHTTQGTMGLNQNLFDSEPSAPTVPLQPLTQLTQDVHPLP